MKDSFTFNFGIKKRNVEFIDIPLNSDLLAFIDPFLVQNNKSTDLISRKIYSRMVNFLTRLNEDYVKPNKRTEGILFLSHLHEPNEIHFGYSTKNKGKAVAKEKATIIFDALRNNRYARHGLQITNEAHTVLLLVEGIGQDIMSDIILNVCRDIFAEFTKQLIEKYVIKSTLSFLIEYYDDTNKKWEEKLIELPVYGGKKVLLIPKGIVSGGRAYSSLYSGFVVRNYVTKELMKASPSEVNDKYFKILSDGTKKAIIRIIKKTYGRPKAELITFVENYPGSLDEFIQYAREHYPAINLDGVI